MNRRYSSDQNNDSRSILTLLLLLAVFVLNGCATTRIDEQGNEVAVVDPYENINRKVYNFNDKVDQYVAEPVANGYKKITPEFIQTGVSNFFNNVKEINTMLNDFLQAKFKQGLEDTGRFAVNTTVGLGGLFDVASKVGLERHQEDFEQTLAVWGVSPGSYLVLPFLGPTTTRGIPGAIVDTATNPLNYLGLMSVQVARMVNTRANAEGALKFIDEAALDPYVFTRESFLQWRNFMATDGSPEANEDFLDFEEELMEEEEAEVTSKPAEATAPKVSNSEAAEPAKKPEKFKLKLEAPDNGSSLVPSIQQANVQKQGQSTEASSPASSQD